MPTYEYRCTACSDQFEIVQSFKDASLKVCEKCHGALRKVYCNVGIAFKGTGFYKNDSKPSNGTGTSAPSSPDSTTTKTDAGTSGPTPSTPDSSSSTPSSGSTGSSHGAAAPTPAAT